MTADGVWLDSADLVLPANLQGLVATEAGYLAVVAESARAPAYSKLNLVSLSELGAPMGDPVLVGSVFGDFGPSYFAGADIAVNEGSTFVLWHEWVANLYSSAGSASFGGYRIHGVRIRSGVPEPVTLSTLYRDEHGTVVSGPGGFAVLWSMTDWQHYLPPPDSFTNRWYPTEWRGAVVAADGPAETTPVELPPPAVLPNPWPANKTPPVRYNDTPHALVSDGTSYLLLWVENQQIRGQRRGADLAPLGDPFIVVPTNSPSIIPVVFVDGAFLVVWSDGADTIFGVRVTSDGTVGDAEPILTVSGATVGSLVASGARCALLTYSGYLPNPGGGTYQAGNARLIHFDSSGNCTNEAPTTLTLVSSMNPSVETQTVTFTGTVTPATATGVVSFYDFGTLVSTQAVVAGSAEWSVGTLAMGTHAITAQYGGDANFLASATVGLDQVVQSSRGGGGRGGAAAGGMAGGGGFAGGASGGAGGIGGGAGGDVGGHVGANGGGAGGGPTSSGGAVGAAGASGSAGTAGASATGGTGAIAGAGGVVATAGASGRGGHPAGGEGVEGTGGTGGGGGKGAGGAGGLGGGSTDQPGDHGDGCSCTTANRSPSVMGVVLLAFSSGLAARRRRRRVTAAPTNWTQDRPEALGTAGQKG